MNPIERHAANMTIFVLAVAGTWMIAHGLDHRLIFGNWGANQGELGFTTVIGTLILVSDLFLAVSL